MSKQERQGSNLSSSSTKKSYLPKKRAQIQEGHKHAKKSQHLIAVYQQSPYQAVAKNTFRFYYGDDK